MLETVCAGFLHLQSLLGAPVPIVEHQMPGNPDYFAGF